MHLYAYLSTLLHYSVNNACDFYLFSVDMWQIRRGLFQCHYSPEATASVFIRSEVLEKEQLKWLLCHLVCELWVRGLFLEMEVQCAERQGDTWQAASFVDTINPLVISHGAPLRSKVSSCLEEEKSREGLKQTYALRL